MEYTPLQNSVSDPQKFPGYVPPQVFNDGRASLTPPPVNLTHLSIQIEICANGLVVVMVRIKTL